MHRRCQLLNRIGTLAQAIDRGAHMRPSDLDTEPKDLFDQHFARIEVVVQAARLHAGPFGDVDQPSVGVAALSKYRRGRIQNALPGALRLRHLVGHRDQSSAVSGNVRGVGPKVV